MKAIDIAQGSYFRKMTGTYVYLRISDASVKYLGLDTDWIYGVCFNGNITRLQPNKPVIAESVNSFLKNTEEDKTWHESIIGTAKNDE